MGGLEIAGHDALLVFATSSGSWMRHDLDSTLSFNHGSVRCLFGMRPTTATQPDEASIRIRR